MIQMETGPVCIGSVLWDIIGRSGRTMKLGHDVPGRITRIPGGVAYNIAQELVRLGRPPIILTSLGHDPAGDDLIAHCTTMQMDMRHVMRSSELHTDSYMAIEDSNGLIAAVADAHSLERAGAAILDPLINGSLGRSGAPYKGLVVVDGNLTSDVLTLIAQGDAFRSCDLRVVPASPGKAERLAPFFHASNACFYVNRIEAEILCQQRFATAQDAACEMVTQGAARAVVTDAQNVVCDAVQGSNPVAVDVPQIEQIVRVTGAGDTFLAAHIDAEMKKLSRQDALHRAVQCASAYVAGKEQNAI